VHLDITSGQRQRDTPGTDAELDGPPARWTGTVTRTGSAAR
jgi:hypothetical protein